MYIKTEKDFISLISSFAVGKRGLGGGLVICKKSDIKNGGVYFRGIYRNKSAEQREIHIGTYGKGIGKITLKQAREKWEEINCWSRASGKERCDFIKERKQILLWGPRNLRDLPASDHHKKMPFGIVAADHKCSSNAIFRQIDSYWILLRQWSGR